MVKEDIDLFDGDLSKIIQKQARPSFIPFRWFVKNETSKVVEEKSNPIKISSGKATQALAS